MKTFCAILLVGLVVYVQGDGHDCDPFAVNVKTDNPVDREGYDADNEELGLSVFLAQKKTSYKITHASPTDLLGANTFCTAPTHGGDCRGVEYARFLQGEYKADREDMLLGVTFKTTFVGYNKKKDQTILYEMTIAGANRDDFIFQWVKDTEIKAYELKSKANPNDRTPIKDIDPEVLAILKAPFALFSLQIGGHALYVTCTGKYAWISYPHNYTPLDHETLNASIKGVKQVALEHKKVKLQIEAIEPDMPEPFSKLITDLVKP